MESLWPLTMYTDILKKIYGDYMQIPPENKRVQHHLEIKPILTEGERIELNKNFI